MCVGQKIKHSCTLVPLICSVVTQYVNIALDIVRIVENSSLLSRFKYNYRACGNKEKL